MPIEEKNILNRLYFIAGGMFLFTLLIAFKIINIQFVDGDKYRALAKKNTIHFNQIIDAYSNHYKIYKNYYYNKKKIFDVIELHFLNIILTKNKK